jgi:hypothetical protein
MGWARTRRRLTGWLALAALALQLALAFGHVHAEDFAGLRPGLAQAVAAGDTPGGEPDSDHLTCDICAAVHLASTLLAPVPPTLALPSAFTAARHDATAPHALPATAAASFHARAPPQA